MTTLANEARNFGARQASIHQEAAQRAALRLLCGIDLDVAMRAESDHPAIIRRIERGLRAERIKGLQRHWCYDLNRHIALKQALDRFRALPEAS